MVTCKATCSVRENENTGTAPEELRKCCNEAVKLRRIRGRAAIASLVLLDTQLPAGEGAENGDSFQNAPLNTQSRHGSTGRKGRTEVGTSYSGTALGKSLTWGA